jgi:hypothetical protein
MDRTTFDALPVMSHAAANAGGVAYGAFYLTSDLAFQKGKSEKRVTYYMRIVKVRNNETVTKNMPRTARPLTGWIQGANPASRTVQKTDPFDGSITNVTETITASGAWPSGAIDYDTSGLTVQALTYPNLPAGSSQQRDGYVQIHDVLT